MAELSSFFDAENVNGVWDREYKAADYARYNSKFIKNGYFPDNEKSLKLFMNEGMTTVLKSGTAYINGYMYENTSDLIVSHDIADGVLNRIDRIVIRLDFSERNITSKVLKGIPASTPVPPAIRRDADIYDLCIATININAGTTFINQSNIIDTRLDSNLCGVVNNLFADAQAAAQMVILANHLKYYNASNVESALAEIRTPLSMYRSEMDINGIYKVYEEKNNGVLVKKSVLSNPDSNGNYKTQTISYYNGTGDTIVRTEVYSITYDIDSNPVNEVLVSSTIEVL